MFNLTGKTALVTGATRGIGKAIAKALHKQGAEIILTGRNQEKLDEVSKELETNTIYVQGSLDSIEKVDELWKKIEEKLNEKNKNVDILVCNAGMTKDNLFMRLTEEQWNEVINVNLTANYRLMQKVIRSMLTNKWGRIISIASVVAATGNPGQANYCASKAGMIGLSKSLAQEVARKNITVNVVSPGFIETDMVDALTDTQKEKIVTHIPMKRIGTDKDITGSVTFLASDEASYITGQTIHVNGGMYLV